MISGLQEKIEKMLFFALSITGGTIFNMKSLRQFDLNLLVLFEALVTERHVSRAAEKVFLSQSAMSHALNRLREQLDDPLLIRTEKGLQPTARALDMLPEVRAALRQIERALAPPTQFDPTTSDRLFTVACTDYFEAVIVPELISHLRKVAPQITVEVEVITEDASQNDLENRSVDLVVGMDATDIVPHHLVVEPWVTEKLVCLLGQQEHPGTYQLSLEDYVKLPHVVFFDQTGDNASTIDHWLKERELSRHHIARTMNYMAAAKIVARTDAVATLPYHMARLFSQLFPVNIVTPPENMPAIEMTMIHHPLFSNDPALIWLKQQINLFGQQVQKSALKAYQ